MAPECIGAFYVKIIQTLQNKDREIYTIQRIVTMLECDGCVPCRKANPLFNGLFLRGTLGAGIEKSQTAYGV